MRDTHLCACCGRRNKISNQPLHRAASSAWYVKELERRLKEKVQQKEASIKEAETDYQAARANVEAVEVAKMACEHFGSLLTNTDYASGR